MRKIKLRVVNIERSFDPGIVLRLAPELPTLVKFLSATSPLWNIFLRHRKWTVSIGIFLAKFRRQVIIRVGETYEALLRKLRLNYG